MASDLQPISQLLQATLNPQTNKEAEAALRAEAAKPGYSIKLLHLVANAQEQMHIRLAGALAFKNLIRERWTDEFGNYQLPENEVSTIKTELVGLMVSVPGNIQDVLGEAISTIADSDFWERWNTLMDDLVARLTPDNAVVNHAVLQIAHSIFKRWRPLFRSDALFTEINHALSKFGVPFFTLLSNMDTSINNHQGNKEVLMNDFKTLAVAMDVFYDLSCQDLPPIIEDNLQPVSGLLHKYLTYDNPLLHTSDDEEPGYLETVRQSIFEVLTLYVQKYNDAFEPFLGQFVGTSWNLLTTLGPEKKYDLVVSKALQFLTNIVKIPEQAQTFNNAETLNQVIEKVVLPNLALRESDVEQFEDEPIEYIRRDLEGSDSDTRRRAATDFLRQLVEQNEQLVTEVVSRYITHFLQRYAQDQKGQWQAKDTAVYLFCSIAAKGTPTAAHGVKAVNSYVNILDFFQKNIAADLTSADCHPIVQVDAIKFVYVFRSQFNPSSWHAAFPLLVQHLNSSNYVIYTYAAIAVERALFLSTDDKQPIIPRADIVSLSKDLLTHLFKLIEKSPQPERVQENEFLMRCVMRVLIVIQDAVLPILDLVLTNFINITMVIRHNPSNPRFYYYHFEGIGALIRYAAQTQSAKLENLLYDPFMAILQNEVEEFMPYIFQLFAALLEFNPSNTLPDKYAALVTPIIQPPLYESKGNVPALIRLLSAIIPRGAATIVEHKQLEPILGVFQKLIATKSHETQGFELIEAVISAFPAATLQPYFQVIIQLMLTRLQNSKTDNFTKCFVRFYHFISSRDGDLGLGADFFINVTDSIQKECVRLTSFWWLSHFLKALGTNEDPDDEEVVSLTGKSIFRPIYLTIILPDTPKLTRPLDRKIAVVSLTKTLADSEAFVDRYQKGWALTCQALLRLLINPPVVASAQAGGEEIADKDVDDPSFGVGFTALNTVRKPARDPFPEITDVKKWVGQYLVEADKRHGGRIAGYVQNRLSAEARSALMMIMG